jgi:hypothetical protein
MTASCHHWPRSVQTGEFRGQWIALDHCRFDRSSNQPVEGDVVDADEDLAELCARLQEASRTHCTILHCDGDMVVESTSPSSPPSDERHSVS